MPIDKQLIRSILINRKEIIQQLTFVPRSIAIEDATPTILVGVRRSGKSYLLYQKMFELASNGHSWDEFLYINFEDERLIGFDIQDFQTLLEAHYANSKQDPILFLDEIQIVHGWERFARRMADEKRQIYITGSNAQMLSREMEASLGGRYIAIQVFPFSFAEFLQSKSFNWNKNTFLSIKGRADIGSLFKEYFYFGGFPELVKINNKRDYLSSIYNKIYLGDIVLRYKVSNAYALEIMMKKITGRLCLALLTLVCAAQGFAQQRDANSDQRNNPAQQQSAQPDPRAQQRQEADRAARGQAEGARQGKLSPEERQALRRQIDEAGHDIYRTRR